MDVDDDISKLSNSLSSFNSLTSLNSIKTTKSLQSLNSINSNDSTNLSSNLKSNNINLDDDSLLLIFKRLNIKDLCVCSLASKKFYKLTKKLINYKRKHIQLHIAVSPYCYYDNYNLAKYLDTSIDQFYSPILLNNNLIFSNKMNLLRPLESLVFITNQFEFANKTIYNSILQLPNLKYLETNDKNFCSNLIKLSRYVNKYSSLTIKHLVIFYSNLNTITKLFPNLVTLSIDDLYLNSTNSDDESINLELKWTFLAIKEERINDSLIDFLFKNCKQLKYLEVNLAEFSKINQLERLLKELNWINEYYLFIFGATYEIRNLLPKYLYRFLNFNFKLTINFIRIESDLKNLEPIYSANETNQFKYFEIKQLENDKRSNLNRLEYYNKIKKLTIDSNRQNLNFQNFKYQLKLTSLTIDDGCLYDHSSEKINNFDLDFNLLINHTLPKTITVIVFKFNRNIAQYILDRLPIILPYLEKTSFSNLGLQGNRAYDFKFLSNLTYLNEINLFNIKFKNEEQLIDAVDNCRFLFKLKVSYDIKFIDHNLQSKFQSLRERLNLKLDRKEFI